MSILIFLGIIAIFVKMIYPIATYLCVYGEKEKTKKAIIIGAGIAILSLIIQFVEWKMHFTLKQFLTGYLVEIFVMSVILLAYRLIFKHKFVLFHMTVLLAPLMLITLLECSDLEADRQLLLLISWVVGIIFCDLYLYCVVQLSDRREQKRQLEFSKARLEAATYKKQQEMYDNEIYNQFIDSCIENLENLKATILAKENTSQADENSVNSLQNIYKDLQKFKPKEYCVNSIINQVIDQMDRQCKAENIAFSVDANANSNVEIDDLSLCSIMTNLLNNAFNHCVDCKREGNENVYINLNINQKGDYLSVQVKNTFMSNIKNSHRSSSLIKNNKYDNKGSNKDYNKHDNKVDNDISENISENVLSGDVLSEKRHLKEHGWGQKILMDIANKYDGSFKVNKKKDEYVATVVVVSSLQ